MDNSNTDTFRLYCGASHVALVVKHSPASAGNVRDVGSVLKSGRAPEGTAIYSSILAWEIEWTEEPGGLQSIESHTTEVT